MEAQVPSQVMPSTTDYLFGKSLSPPPLLVVFMFLSPLPLALLLVLVHPLGLIMWLPHPPMVQYQSLSIPLVLPPSLGPSPSSSSPWSKVEKKSYALRTRRNNKDNPYSYGGLALDILFVNSIGRK